MKRNIIIINILTFIIVGVLVVWMVKGFFPLPIGIRHLFHLIFPPNNLYQPIVLDKFLFYEKGFTKTYYLKPNYLDIYEIGFLIDKNGIESTYKFKGKIKVEFFVKDEFLIGSMITSMDSALYKGTNMTYYKQISLYKFDIPLQEKYINDLSVKLTVLEPVQELKRFSDNVTLYIAVSATP